MCHCEPASVKPHGAEASAFGRTHSRAMATKKRRTHGIRPLNSGCRCVHAWRARWHGFMAPVVSNMQPSLPSGAGVSLSSGQRGEGLSIPLSLRATSCSPLTCSSPMNTPCVEPKHRTLSSCEDLLYNISVRLYDSIVRESVLVSSMNGLITRSMRMVGLALCIVLVTTRTLPPHPHRR